MHCQCAFDFSVCSPSLLPTECCDREVTVQVIVTGRNTWSSSVYNYKVLTMVIIHTEVTLELVQSQCTHNEPNFLLWDWPLTFKAHSPHLKQQNRALTLHLVSAIMRLGGSHVLNSFYRVTPLSCTMLLVKITFSLNTLFGDWKPSNPSYIFYMHDIIFILNDSSTHVFHFLPFL